MFAGIVAGIGFVRSKRRRGDGLRIVVDLGRLSRGLRRGDSVALSGVCLTSIGRRAAAVTFDVVPETLRRTRLGSLESGDPVHVERAIRWGDEIGGHLVSGHVDGLARVIGIRRAGDTAELVVEVPRRLTPLVATQGSIALDGVSLTVAEKRGSRVRIALVSHTLAVTTLGSRRPGDLLHVEVDSLARIAFEAMRAFARARPRTPRRELRRRPRSARPRGPLRSIP
jgi:riboflavin synthase alpha subunit